MIARLEAEKNHQGTDGEYDYLLNVTSPDLNGPQVATLIVRPHH